MTVKLYKSVKGPYYRWGLHGKKYYFYSLEQQKNAMEKALKQGQAIHANE